MDKRRAPMYFNGNKTMYCTCVGFKCRKCRELYPDGWMNSKDTCCRCHLDDMNKQDCPCVQYVEEEAT